MCDKDSKSKVSFFGNGIWKGYVPRHKPTWVADVLKERYGPKEKKQIKLMIPVSRILNWFKRRKK